jgi:hypothetical protein
MEFAVLEGAAALLKRAKPIVHISSKLDPAREAKLLERLSELGYAAYWHTAELFNPLNHAGNTENVFGSDAERCLLCVDMSLERHLTGFIKAAGADAA